MPLEPDEPRRRSLDHQLGEKLDDLSVDELTMRILHLHEEILRLEAARDLKQGAQATADALFKS